MPKKLPVAISLALAGVWITTDSICAQEKRPIVLDRAPVRMVQDPYPTFNGIAMDSERGEVIIADDNRSSLLVYDTEFEPADKLTEERRKISGPKTHLGYICTLAISSEHNELYTVANDWKDNMSVFPLDASGEVAPIRELNVDHGAWGIFLDRKNDEMFVTTEHVNKVSVYRRTASGDDDSLRYIQGPNTGLADPHGIYVDSENNEIFVTNHGHWRETKPGEGGTLFWGKRAAARGARVGGAPHPPAPSTGKFLPASIAVYSRTASGDVAPLRTIQGPKTKLNWPLGIYLDPVNGQLVVATSGDNSILFFDKNANGDVAPVRVIKGLATAIEGPSGVLVDPKRNELWVTNWNNHMATVYPMNAQGNVAPIRVIRSAPKDTPATAGLGNPGAVAYDPKRKEILVPN